MECIFCNIDTSKMENTILDETENFYILPAVGSLVDGYIIIITKEHLNSMANIPKEVYNEYNNLIEKYRDIFYKIYGKYPIIFEHGTPIVDNSIKASSVIHAHIHIVNHNFSNEQDILSKYNFEKIDDITNVSDKKNYISYINQKDYKYVSYDFPPISQLMRKIIAKDLNYEEKFNWKCEAFEENIYSTIEKLKNFKKIKNFKLYI